MDQPSPSICEEPMLGRRLKMAQSGMPAVKSWWWCAAPLLSGKFTYKNMVFFWQIHLVVWKIHDCGAGFSNCDASRWVESRAQQRCGRPPMVIPWLRTTTPSTGWWSSNGWLSLVGLPLLFSSNGWPLLSSLVNPHDFHDWLVLVDDIVLIIDGYHLIND